MRTSTSDVFYRLTLMGMKSTLCISGMQISKNFSNADQAQQFLCKANNIKNHFNIWGQLRHIDSSKVIQKNEYLWPVWLLELCSERGCGDWLMKRIWRFSCESKDWDLPMAALETNPPVQHNTYGTEHFTAKVATPARISLQAGGTLLERGQASLKRQTGHLPRYSISSKDIPKVY